MRAGSEFLPTVTGEAKEKIIGLSASAPAAPAAHWFLRRYANELAAARDRRVAREGLI